MDWNKSSYKLATCADDMMHRIWRFQPKNCIEENNIHGQAERMDLVQYPTKQSFVVTDFQNTKENDDTQISKKRRIRSPLKTLPTTIGLEQSPQIQIEVRI